MYALLSVEISQVDAIYQALQPKISVKSQTNFWRGLGRDPEFDPQENELKIFLQSQEAKEFTQKVYMLSPDEKEQLMHKIDRTPGGDDTWQARRNYLAAIIQAGGNIGTCLGSNSAGTFLGEVTLHDDKEGVEFALAHGANTTLKIKSLRSYPLSLAKTYPIALLLLNNGADKPLRYDDQEQFGILQGTLYHSEQDSRLLKLFKDRGFNLCLRDRGNNKRTLLHFLCDCTTHYTSYPQHFYDKFHILLQAGVDREALTDDHQTALAIINSNLRTYPSFTGILLYAKSLLEAPETTKRITNERPLMRY